MTMHSTRRRLGVAPRTGTLLALLLVLGVVYAPAALANHPGPQLGAAVQPQFIPGNPTCANFIISDAELKTDGVQSTTYDDGTLFVEVTVRNTALGPVFDYEVISGGTVAGVVVKGGPDANLYDYDTVGNQTSDEDLHAPVNHQNNRFYGLSHISFCYDEVVFVNALLSGTKFLDGTTTGLEGWDIYILDDTQALLATVSTDTNGEWSYTTAEFQEGTSVTLYVCEEQRAGWAQTSPTSGDAGTIDIAGYGTCYVVSFTAGDTDELIPGLDFENQPTGAIRIDKDAKHADTSGNTSPNLVATFNVTGPDGFDEDVTTDVNGDACIDGLVPGTYSIEETGVPTGYAAPTIANVVVPANALVSCTSGTAVEVDVENTPLTDIIWEVDSQHNGATLTVVACYADLDDDGSVDDLLPGYPMTVGDGTDTLPNLIPTDPAITISCDFTVDP